MGDLDGGPGGGLDGAAEGDGEPGPVNGGLKGMYPNIGDDRLAHEIERMRTVRKEAQDRKKQITRCLRNLKRQRQRLKTKAKNLSTTDLVDVLCIRADAEQKVIAKAKAKALAVAA